MELLNQRQAAQLLGLSEKTLESWRYRGRGPRYFKAGGAVRYTLPDLEAWLRSRCVETVDSAAGQERPAAG